jgi:DNA-binding beta-propeller fold protein YncE
MKTQFFRAVLFIGLLFSFVMCSSPDDFTPGLPIRDSSPVSELWVVGGSSEEVSVVNINRLLAGKTPHTVTPFLGGWLPNDIVFHEGKGYIVNSSGNSITVFSLRDPRQRQEIRLFANANPYAIALVRQENIVRALVTCLLDNSLAVVRIEGIGGWFEGKFNLTTGKAPEGIVSDGTRRAWVAMCGTNLDYSYGDGYVLALDVSDSSIANWQETAAALVTTNPQNVLFDAAESQIYVLSTGDYFMQDGALAVLNADTLALVNSCELSGSPGSFILDKAAGKIYLAGSVYDASWNSSGYLACYVASTLAQDTQQTFSGVAPADLGITALALDPERKLLFVTHGDWQDVNYVYVFGLETGALLHTISLTPGANLSAMAWIKVE